MLSVLDSRLVLILAVFYGIASFINYLVTIYFSKNSIYIYTLNNLPIFIIDYIVVLVFISFVSNSTKQSINKRNHSWIKIGLKHLFLSFIFNTVIVLTITIYEILIKKVPLKYFSIKSQLESVLAILDINFMVYFAMMFCVYFYHYFKLNEEGEKEKNKLRGQLINTRLNLLTSNLQPHFLFNSLNSIVSLIDLDKNKAKDTIVDLGSLLRDFLNKQDSIKITLNEELDILEKYIRIIKVRFDDNFSFKKSITARATVCKVPYLLFQPIVENAVKHGYSANHKKIDIELNVLKEKENLIIKIKNNGKPLENNFLSLKKNIGIENTIERLKTIYKDNFEFDIRNLTNEKGVEVKIIIPYEI